ncbi:MAG TPA: putative sulfate/molybdate transporter [Acidobacteriota bacterium]|jgi:MFS superfamily sulfate permease-like transporter|nr:putative sulfate/molybdate transporter [Acidobacteriota bacterium]
MERGSIRFDRNELAGAFGDIGTDLPLIVGMILAAGLDSASVLIMFGMMQIFTALQYRMPMPVQPLKAMAVIVITQKLDKNILYGGGLAIGICMLLLSLTGAIDWLARVVPKPVIRGIQFGLGIQLAILALKDYVPAEKAAGYWLAAIGFALIVLFLGNRKYPAALFVIFVGALYAFLFKLTAMAVIQSAGLTFPQFHQPAIHDILSGFVILALPQIPLSLGNSILATRQISQDFFPERSLSVRQISLTYSLMNLVSPFFNGIPTCHGSGGMAGHYAFGARTGGSVILYGLLYVTLGLFFANGFAKIVQVFPLPILGVILLFEGLTLLTLVRDLYQSKKDFSNALLVGLLASGLPYGYLIGLIVGIVLDYLTRAQKPGPEDSRNGKTDPHG